MLLIHCPWCGERDQTEFSAHGEAHLVRPVDPDALSDAEWADYVFYRTNPMGLHRERWIHAHGCRRWFIAVRDTVTDHIHATYPPFDTPPRVAAEQGEVEQGEEDGA